MAAANSSKWAWEMIEQYFQEDRYRLTRHHLQSYNDMVKVKLPNLLHDKNKLPSDGGDYLFQQDSGKPTDVDVHMFVGRNHDDIIDAYLQVFGHPEKI